MTKNTTASILRRNPLFRNFLAANTISLLGSSVFDVAIPLYVLEKTHSAIALSMVTVALHLPFLIMAPFTGYSVDHFNKRRLMLATDVGQVLCMLVLLLYDRGATNSLWAILAAVFVAKTLMHTSETVMTFQLIPSLVPSKDLSDANTWFLSSQRFVQIGGPLAAGIMLSVAGIHGCILLNIMSFTANLYLVYKTRHLNQLIEGESPRQKHPVTIRAVAQNFKNSVAYVWSSELFRPFIFMMFVWNLSAFLPNTPTMTYYFTRTEGISSANYGVIVALLGAFSMIGFLGSSWVYNRFRFQTTFNSGALAQAILATVALLFIRHPFALAMIFALSRSASALVSMGTFLLRQTRIPKHQVGGVNACLRMFFMSAMPISAVLQGLMIQTVGVEASMVFGVMCLWGCFFYGRKLAREFGKKAERAHQDQAKAA